MTMVYLTTLQPQLLLNSNEKPLENHLLAVKLAGYVCSNESATIEFTVNRRVF